MLVERVHALTGGGPPPIAPPLGPMLTHPVAVPPDTALLSVVAVPPDAALSSVVAVPPDAALSSVIAVPPNTALSSVVAVPPRRSTVPNAGAGLPHNTDMYELFDPVEEHGLCHTRRCAHSDCARCPTRARACRRRPDPSLCKRAAWRGAPGARAARGGWTRCTAGCRRSLRTAQRCSCRHRWCPCPPADAGRLYPRCGAAGGLRYEGS
ncbi:hypothetical protein B0H14DRAFT_1190650 [Mycena olivaceomarginata]|nr:hypothetical protein B0H14DRAFT_1190650 [Mycena olivaceomarginata]